MNNFWKWLVVIAGLSSGVGAGFAREFAEKWYDLLLIAKDRKKTDTFIKYLTVLYPVHISSMIFDFSKKEQWAKFISELKKIKNIHTVINCVWYTSHKYISNKKVKTPKDILTQHDITAMEISHETLKIMKKEKHGNIIHVTSLLSLLAIGDNPISATSKIFLNTFSDQLHHILIDDNVSIQTLCPRFTDVDFGKIGKQAFNEKAVYVRNIVKKSLFCKKNGELVCIPGIVNIIILTIYQILPQSRSHKIFRRLAH